MKWTCRGVVESSSLESKEIKGKSQTILNLQMQVREIKGPDGWEAYSDETSPIPPTARMSLWFSNLDEKGGKALRENLLALGYAEGTDFQEWMEALPGFKVGFMVEESVGANGHTYYNARYPGDYETFGSRSANPPSPVEMEALRKTVSSLFTNISPRPPKTFTPPPLEQPQVISDNEAPSGDAIPF